MKLNNWTPSTVRVCYVQHAGTWWGPNNYFIHVIANGIPMMESSKPRDIERTQAAWNLVFNRFCPGRKNNFYYYPKVFNELVVKYNVRCSN